MVSIRSSKKSFWNSRWSWASAALRCDTFSSWLPAFGRRFAWAPNVPEVWIEVGRGETLRDRAQEVFTEHYRALERRFGVEAVQPEAQALSGKAWLSTVEVTIDIPKLYTPPVETFFALLGSV